jgi:hypothetical protein
MGIRIILGTFVAPLSSTFNFTFCREVGGLGNGGFCYGVRTVHNDKWFRICLKSRLYDSEEVETIMMSLRR